MVEDKTAISRDVDTTTQSLCELLVRILLDLQDYFSESETNSSLFLQQLLKLFVANCCKERERESWDMEFPILTWSTGMGFGI